MSTTIAEPVLSPSTIRGYKAQFSARHSFLLIGLLTIASDFVSLSLAISGGIGCWTLVHPDVSLHCRILWLMPMCTVAMLALMGPYPGLGLTAVQHLRFICRGVTVAYFLLTGALILNGAISVDSCGILVLAWTFSLVAVPLARSLMRALLTSHLQWGVPVVIIGAGETGRRVIQTLRMNRILGLQPVICVDDDPNKRGYCEGVPVVGSLLDAASAAEQVGAQFAIIAIPSLERLQLVRYLRRWRMSFRRLLIVPDLAGIASLWTEPRDLGGLLAFEIDHQLLNPWNRAVKRAVDIVGSLFGMMIAAPLVALSAIGIKLVSPGNAFYAQEREGQGGRAIRIFKLRTMYPGAEQLLSNHLASDPSAREEWNRFCKLKNDPRILKGTGHFLRSTSIDELPQLWNILKGEMSLVGPRPFPGYHNARFDSEFRAVRTQVRPGLTGLWQVSARSNGDLTVQEALDAYYIRNWSLWLDLYILLRTLRAVLTREGAR